MMWLSGKFGKFQLNDLLCIMMVAVFVLLAAYSASREPVIMRVYDMMGR